MQAHMPCQTLFSRMEQTGGGPILWAAQKLINNWAWQIAMVLPIDGKFHWYVCNTCQGYC